MAWVETIKTKQAFCDLGRTHATLMNVLLVIDFDFALQIVNPWPLMAA